MTSRHRDAFGRVSSVDGRAASMEHFINPKDGRLAQLFVQGTVGNSEEQGEEEEGIVSGDNESKWTRIGPPERDTQPIISLVYWVYSSVLVKGSQRRRWDGRSTLIVAVKWVPSCLLLALMLLVPRNLEGESRNGGYFDPIHYRDWTYQKVPLNQSEAVSECVPQLDGAMEESEPLLHENGLEISELEQHSRQTQVVDAADNSSGGVDEEHLRGLGPRYLCFLRDSPAGESTGYETWKVSDWLQAHEGQGENDTDYVFISYTRKQFCVATEADLSRWDISDEHRQAYAKLSPVNRNALVRYGEHAARSAGKRAFWIDFECIRDIEGIAEASSQSYDVYRICDIVRAASSMVIVVGPTIETQLHGSTQQPFTKGTVTEWLQQWGTRLWTLPEILLCPSEHRINIYAVGSPLPPEQIAKRNFVARAALPDANLVRQLIDHYESSIHLSPLELISLALRSFSVRQTDQFNQGDIAYALMGLLRRRPLVNRDDTGFEAFARLSLANNSDKLLERLLCIRTERFDAAWHDTKDAWGMPLWNIEPHCQVAGIVDDQTVSLDGAYGAAIQWDSMGQVAFLKRSTMARNFAKVALRGVPIYLIIGLGMTIAAAVIKSDEDRRAAKDASAKDDSVSGTDISTQGSSTFTAFLVVGLVFLIPSLVIILFSPMMLLNIYRGKFWSTQALFIGMEGIPGSLGTLEHSLFGFNHGRLKWSAAGSSLSRHTLSSCGECVALPPTKDHAAATDGDRQDGTRLFTLVDTYTMVATAFRAVRPPTAVMVCGQEGGMQRAILCSYDWKRATFAREAVLRMNTTVLDRMFRVSRFRFALRRRTDAATSENSVKLAPRERSRASEQEEAETGSEGGKQKLWANRRVDLALIPCMWFVSGMGLHPFQESPYSTLIVRGCVMNAAAIILQIVNYKVLFRIRIGHYLGMAVLIKGIAGLASSVAVLKNPSESNLGGDIVIRILVAAANSIIGPCFVLLTAAWYPNSSGGCILRLLLWTSSSLVLIPTINLTGNLVDPRSQPAAFTGLGALCIILSAYIFAYVDMPDDAMWLHGAPRNVLLRDRQRWRKHRRSLPLTKLIAQPAAWCVFAATFFGGASIPLDGEGLLRFPNYDLYQRAEFAFLNLLPFAALAFLLVTIPVIRVPALILTAGLAFTGRMLLTTNIQAKNLNKGMLFLWNMGIFWKYLIWMVVVLDNPENDAVDSRNLNLVANIIVAFAGTALGPVVGYGALQALVNRSLRLVQTKIFMSVMFSLQTLSLVGWFLWSTLRRLRLRHGVQTQPDVGHDGTGFPPSDRDP